MIDKLPKTYDVGWLSSIGTLQDMYEKIQERVEAVNALNKTISDIEFGQGDEHREETIYYELGVSSRRA